MAEDPNPDRVRSDNQWASRIHNSDLRNHGSDPDP
jgi:hypothetical protein